MLRRNPWLRRLVIGLNIFTFLFVTVACDYLKTKYIDSEFKAFTKALETANKIDNRFLGGYLQALNIQTTSERLKDNVNQAPKLKGRLHAEDKDKAAKWITTNEASIREWLSSITSEIEGSRSEIFLLSKHAYKETEAENSAVAYGLVYFQLQYLRAAVRTLIEMGMPLTLAVQAPSLKDHKASEAFRDELAKTFFGFVGLGIVLDQDIARIRDIIQKLEDVQKAPTFVVTAVKNTEEAVQKHTKKHNRKLAEAFAGLQKEKPELFDEAMAKIKEARQEFKTVTLLYTPGQSYSPIVKILTILGNITWGLVNTIIGLGIIVVTMIVSPFTRYVDFPSFRIAENGMQIYVDVSGMGPMAGKMSMGLFEFDNDAGWDFASFHEGGHSIQSALLGPLYLPVVLASYLICGFDEGFMEDWADALAASNP